MRGPKASGGNAHEERAAICEFDAGLTPEEAERGAGLFPDDGTGPLEGH